MEKPHHTTPLESKHHQLGARWLDLAGWRLPQSYTAPETELLAARESVALADISCRGKLALHGAAASALLQAAFGAAPGRVGEIVPLEFNGRPLLSARLAPAEVLLVTFPGQERPLSEFLLQKLGDSFVSIVDQTGGLAGLLLVGPAARPLLGEFSALSFHPEDLPNLRLVQTSFARLRAIIFRHDLGDLPAFQLYFDRSYAGYLWDALLAAGSEFALQPLGWQALHLLSPPHPPPHPANDAPPK